MPENATLERLQSQRFDIAGQMRNLARTAAEEDREFTADEQSQHDAMVADYDRLTASIERLEEAEERVAALEQVNVDRHLLPGARASRGGRESRAARRLEDRADVLDDMAGPDADDGAYADIFERFVRYGPNALEASEFLALRRGQVQLGAAERAALGSGGTGAAGGYLVPTGFLDRFYETRQFIGALRAVADVFTTSSGEDLPFPTSDDTGNSGAILTENTQIGEQDPTFGSKTLRAYVFTSKLVRVPWQLLQDERVNLVGGRLPTMLGRRIARAENAKFTTGTGTGEPEGFLTVASVGKTGATGQTTTVKWTDLVDLEHSIDRDYRDNARFMANDQTIAVIKKLLDGNGRPLWLPSTREGDPATINGYPYTVNNDMPTPAASAKTIAFGDFSFYVIRDVEGTSLVRLDERYADFLQTGFFAYSRTDGILADTSAIKVYQQSAS